MWNSKVVMNIIIGVLLALCVGTFLFQFKQNMDLKEDFNLKNSRFKEAKSISKRLGVLEKQTSEMKYKEDILERRIPFNEKHPFNLMKLLSKAGGEAGLRKIVFKMNHNFGQADDSGMPFQPGAGGAVPQVQQTQGDQLSEFSPNPENIFLIFEGTFPQTMAFIKKITSWERVVTVQGIEIKREEKILPYQKVSLSLRAYTFVK